MKQLSHTAVYQNPWIKLWEDEVEYADGTRRTWAYLDRVDSGAIIIPVDHEGNVYVLKEFRHPVQTTITAFPAGGREGRETNLEAAKRELKEETGMTANTWTYLQELFPDPAQNKQRISVFLAEDLTIDGVNHGPGENIQVHKTTLKDLKDQITTDSPCSSQFLACLFLLERELSTRQSS